MKANGRLCVAFNLDNYGVCINDKLTGCDGDKINVRARSLRDGCLPPYAPAMYWSVTTLLHEGTHATQSYDAAPTGDRDKDKAAKMKVRACNEVDAHTAENDWIVELKAALEKLKNNQPVDGGASQATKDIYDALAKLGAAEKAAAIAELEKALDANKAGNDTAIECYNKAKTAFQAFIDAPYGTPAEKDKAKKDLKDALEAAAWKNVLSHYSVPKMFLSDGGSGILRQIDGASTISLDTGMTGIMDFQLLNQNTVLWVSGRTGATSGELRCYVDSNADTLFASSELAATIPYPVGMADNLSLAVRGDVNVAAGLLVAVYDSNITNPRILRIVDASQDFVPESIGAPIASVPLTTIVPPLRFHFRQTGEMWGVNEIDSTNPGFTGDDELLVMTDTNADTFYETSVVSTWDSQTMEAPAWKGDLAVGGQQVVITGELGHPVSIHAVDQNFVPVELLAQFVHNNPNGTLVNLSRPVTASDRIQMRDLQTNAVTPVMTPVVPFTQAYGFSMWSCEGPITLSTNAVPKINNPSFAFVGHGAPPSALGLLLATDSQDLAGTDVFNLSLPIHVDFINATEVYGLDMFSDANGFNLAPAPLPNDAGLIGKNYFAAAVWFFPGPCLPSPVGLSSSHGLQITIQAP